MKTGKIIEDALQFCSRKANSKASAILKDLRSNNRWTHSTFRYCIARTISGYLLAKYSNLKDAYIFGSTLEDRAGSSSDIDIILVCKKKDAALVRDIEKLDVEILNAYRRLVGNGTSGLRRLLDINVVESRDLKEKKGCASLIRSIYTPAIRIS